MTSQKFHSPYHFIPVNTQKTETIDWGKNDKKNHDLKRKTNHYVRHDYWHVNGESGRITCRIICQTPLVIGGKQTPGDKMNSGQVHPFRQRGTGRYAIPGNSLRGMISSLAEAISQSAMRVLTADKESTYSVRKQARDAQNMNLGLLYKNGDQFHICPLATKESVGNYKEKNQDASFIQSCSHPQHTYQHRLNPQFVFREGSGSNSLYNEAGPGRDKGILYIRVTDEASRENMPKKHHESFIPWDDAIERNMAEGKGPVVAKALVQTTENMLRARHKADDSFPQLPKGYQRNWNEEDASILQDGDLIYFRAKAGQVTELGYSAIWRLPVAGSLHDAFERSGGPDSLPWNRERTTLTPAEALFGVVEDEPDPNEQARNLASRVRFGDAVSEHNIVPGNEITLKILASPKPPSPAMYFNSATGYVAKTDLDMNKHAPNGRKLYLPHNNKNAENTWETTFTTSDNWKPHLKCKPIPAGSEFEFHIYYENLSKAELGLMRTALEPDAEFIHRLGLGKPLGLGEIKLNIKKLERIDRAQRYNTPSLTNERYRCIDTEAVPADNSLIDKNACDILKTLGNPDNIVAPVISYPFSDSEPQKPYPEKKGFQWFTENEKAPSPQHLKPIRPGKALPTLDSSHRKK